MLVSSISTTLNSGPCRSAGPVPSSDGAGVYLTLVGLLGVALGWIIRTTAGAISALVGLLLILPVLVGFLPGSLGTSVAQVLPSNAGGSFMSSVQLPDTLAPWTGLVVLVLWVAVALVAAAVVVRRRDA